MQIGDLEYYYLVGELKKYLVNNYVSKIYRMKTGAFRLKVAKFNLIINVPKFVFLTDKSYVSEGEPDGFVMALRKRLSNHRIVDIIQPQMERILIIKFNDFELVFEMFSRGNVILMNKDGNIELALNNRIKSRQINKGNKYVLPSSNKILPFNISEQDIILNDKKNYVAGVFSHVKLSPKYIEEAFLRANVDPREINLSLTEKKVISKNIIDICNERKFLAYYKDDHLVDISVARLSRYSNLEMREFNSMIELLSAVSKDILEQRPKENVDNSKEVLDKMKEHLIELEREYETAKKTGDLIYLKYNFLETLMDKVKSARKNLSENEINNIISKYNAKLKGNYLEIDVGEDDE